MAYGEQDYGFDLASNQSVTTGATSVQAVPSRSGNLRRTQIIITNTSAAAIVTIAKGDSAAVSSVGIRLNPGGIYGEADDGGYGCWQGAIQVISDVAGTVSVTEQFVVK
jgi:hypothetical protein